MIILTPLDSALACFIIYFIKLSEFPMSEQMRRLSDGAELFPHSRPAGHPFCPNGHCACMGLREILQFPPKLKETKGKKEKALLFC